MSYDQTFPLTIINEESTTEKLLDFISGSIYFSINVSSFLIRHSRFLSNKKMKMSEDMMNENASRGEKTRKNTMEPSSK